MQSQGPDKENNSEEIYQHMIEEVFDVPEVEKVSWRNAARPAMLVAVGNQGVAVEFFLDAGGKAEAIGAVQEDEVRFAVEPSVLGVEELLRTEDDVLEDGVCSGLGDVVRDAFQLQVLDGTGRNANLGDDPALPCE